MIYRSYNIEQTKDGFYWIDERNFYHYAEGVTGKFFPTDEAAMNDIDKYRKEKASKN